MRDADALPLRVTVRLVSRECFPRNESLPEVEQLLDELIDDFPGQKAFNAACRRGASVRALEYLLGRAAPDWNEAIKSAAQGGHLHVLKWMATKRQDHREPWRVDFSGTLQAAAAQGHLETAKWLYGYDPGSAQALSSAASGGHLPVVQWLWGQGARGGDDNPVDAAAANGHLGVVTWLHERGARGYHAMENAAAGGHLEVVEWLHSNDVRYNAGVMDAAAASGHLEVIQWLHANINGQKCWGGMCSDRAYVSAVCNGHFEVMKWIASHYPPRHWTTIAGYAASHGRLDVLKWMCNHGKGYLTPKAMDVAATNGHLEVVKWLHARKQNCTKAALDGAATNGHLSVVEWLHDNRSEGCTTDAMDGAAGNGHLYVVCWLHDYRTQGCTANAMKRAAENGHLHVVEWLYKVYRGQFLIPDLMDSAALAACGGYLKIVQLLATNGWLSHPKYLTSVMANAFMYGRVPIVEWLLGRGYQVRAKDNQWAQGSWATVPRNAGTIKIFFKGVEARVPDVRGIVMVRGDLRMVRWLWLHGCKSYATEELQPRCCSKLSVVTRWLIENGLRLDREAIWTNFWYYGQLEVVHWVLESDRVWVLCKTLEKGEVGLEKTLWLLENAEFLNIDSRIAARNAIYQVSSASVQWVEARLQAPEVREWCFGGEEQVGTTKRQRTR